MGVSQGAKAAIARKPNPEKSPVLVAGGAARALDRIIHDRFRLGVVSALAVSPTLTFSDLKKALNATDGNLSVHARKLEDAGYIACEKKFEGRLPQTVYRLTRKGRTALEAYVTHMEALIRATRSQK